MKLLFISCLLLASALAQTVGEPILRCGSGGCTGGMAAPSPCGSGGCGGGSMGMGMMGGSMGMGMMGGSMGMGNMGMGNMGMGMESDGMEMNEFEGEDDMIYTVTPVITGYTYKMVPKQVKYTYQKFVPSTATTFTEVPYVNPCAAGCQSHNPKCCHKEITYQTKTIPKVVEETVQVPVEVDVPNSPCGCHVSRPQCCGGSSSVRAAPAPQSSCSCGATTPHCCSLSSPLYSYGQAAPRNYFYGAVGYPFQEY